MLLSLLLAAFGLRLVRRVSNAPLLVGNRNVNLPDRVFDTALTTILPWLRAVHIGEGRRAMYLRACKMQLAYVRVGHQAGNMVERLIGMMMSYNAFATQILE